MHRRAYRRALAELRRALSAVVGRRSALVVIEGRDAAGKTGAIRRLVKGLRARVAHLGPPVRGAPYLDRWWREVPGPGELVVCDRSWYNRAALEPVMGYCTPAERTAFLAEVPAFELEIAARGVALVKLLLDVSRAEQARRLARRRRLTAIDAAARAHYETYGALMDEAVAHTGGWIRICADDKRAARLAVFREVIAALAPSKPDQEVDDVYGRDARAAELQAVQSARR
jgi:polyphosphate kinase 2 (PPK2 family)